MPPSLANGRWICGARERPKPPNSAEKKSFACAAGASAETHSTAAAPNAKRLPEVQFILVSRRQYSDDVETFIAWRPVEAVVTQDAVARLPGER